jgi:hypothetical protein
MFGRASPRFNVEAVMGALSNWSIILHVFQIIRYFGFLK